MMNKQFTLRAIMLVALVSTIIGIGVIPILSLQSTYGAIEDGAQLAAGRDKPHVAQLKLAGMAPIATSGNNIYIAWWTNKTGNDEVMFRASTDGGKTFGDKINLSNTTKSDSQDVQIGTFGSSDSNVIVTWWERNATSNEPLVRTSTDMGATFGPTMRLSANETIGSSGG
jgi:hypothetical protein